MATFAELYGARPASRDEFSQQLVAALNGLGLPGMDQAARERALNEFFGYSNAEPQPFRAQPSVGLTPLYDVLSIPEDGQRVGDWVGDDVTGYRQLTEADVYGQRTPIGYSFVGGNLNDPYQSNNHSGNWNFDMDAAGNVTGAKWTNNSTGGWLVNNGWMIPLALATAGAAGMLGGGGAAGAAEGAAAAGGAAEGAAAAGAAGAAPISASSPTWLAGYGSTAGLTPAQIASVQASLAAGGAGAAGAAGWAAPISASPISSLGPAATWGDKLTYLTQGLGGAAAGAAGSGGSSLLNSALRLAPLAGLALGGKPSIPNPPATDPQANIDAGVKSINDLFATDKRAPIYQQVYNDSYGLQSSRLNENRQDALRKLRFGLARSGLTTGSADVSAHGLEQREFGRALSDASTAAQGQADQVRANDEKTRLNLIAQMRAGLDSADATQSALTQMADNANAARAQTRYDALDSYMGAVAPTINNFQVRSGQQAAQQMYNTRFPQNRISLSGRSGTIVG